MAVVALDARVAASPAAAIDDRPGHGTQFLLLSCYFYTSPQSSRGITGRQTNEMLYHRLPPVDTCYNLARCAVPGATTALFSLSPLPTPPALVSRTPFPIPYHA